MKHKGKPRPPRIYIDQDGKRYIKLNGKKVHIQSNISNEQLVRIVINNFQKKQKRRRKLRKKFSDKSKEFEDLEKSNKNQSSSSNLDLAKLLFFISSNKKDKEEQEKKQGEIEDRRRQQQLLALPGANQPPALPPPAANPPLQLPPPDNRYEYVLFGRTDRLHPKTAENMMNVLKNIANKTKESEQANKDLSTSIEQYKKKEAEDILKAKHTHKKYWTQI